MAQTIYLRPDATEYEELCEECLGDMEEPQSLRHDVAVVHGRLRPEADVGFTCCGRGHRVACGGSGGRSRRLLDVTHTVSFGRRVASRTLARVAR